MSEAIPADGISDAIVNTLQEYTQDVTEKVKKAEDITAKECRDNLKADSPRKSGKYAEGWGTTVTLDTPTEKQTVIHNKKYRLTHLLENGHATRDGGRTKAFPHIKKNEEKANEAFEHRVLEALEK